VQQAIAEPPVAPDRLDRNRLDRLEDTLST